MNIKIPKVIILILLLSQLSLLKAQKNLNYRSKLSVSINELMIKLRMKTILWRLSNTFNYHFLEYNQPLVYAYYNQNGSIKIIVIDKPIQYGYSHREPSSGLVSIKTNDQFSYIDISTNKDYSGKTRVLLSDSRLNITEVNLNASYLLSKNQLDFNAKIDEIGIDGWDYNNLPDGKLRNANQFKRQNQKFVRKSPKWKKKFPPLKKIDLKNIKVTPRKEYKCGEDASTEY